MADKKMALRVSSGELNIGMPTPVEVAASLMLAFTEDQANTIAAEVYQPIRDMLKAIVMRGVR